VRITLGGEVFEVRTPSGSESGLKIDPEDGEPFSVVAGKRTGARVLINPFEQIIRNPGVGFQLKPHFLAEHVISYDLLGFIDDQVVVGYDMDVSRDEIDAIDAELGASILWCWWPTKYCTLHLPIDVPVRQALEHYATHDRVRFALPNNLAWQTATPPPDDPEYLNDRQQQLRQVWVYRDDPEEEGAWDIVEGSHEVVIAIIGMGFTLDHPDIIENIWINANEVPEWVLSAVGDLDGNGEVGPLDLDVTGPEGARDGLVTFADLDELAIDMGYGDSVCAIANAPPFDRCNPGDLVNGDAEDPEPPEFYGWEDGLDGDETGDGYPDDVVGWAFAESEAESHNLPVQWPDYNQHGSTVAGIVAAVADNGLDMAGVAWRARLMSVRPVPMPVDGWGSPAPGEGWPAMRSAVITALAYAVAHGADIALIELGFYASINLEVTNWCMPAWVSSVSDYGDKWDEYEDGLREEIGEVDLSHTLVAIPAGNCPIDIDSEGVFAWPGDLAGPNRSWNPSLVRVGGVDLEDNLWLDFMNPGFSSGSSFAVDSVDIAAPSVQFVGLLMDAFDGGTTEPEEQGTSFAAPLVAGAAALVLSFDAELRASGNAEELADRILRNADEGVGDLDGKVAGGRRLNAAAAVRNDRPAE
jgi:subtilisin family serine protease